MATKFGMPYFETSAFTGENVHETVEEVIQKTFVRKRAKNQESVVEPQMRRETTKLVPSPEPKKGKEKGDGCKC